MFTEPVFDELIDDWLLLDITLIFPTALIGELLTRLKTIKLKVDPTLDFMSIFTVPPE